jgi:predicted aconitase with swiveling domain
LKKIKLRSIVDGEATGEILFTSQPIAFLQGVDPERGCVSDQEHELYSKPFAGKILVFPNAVGSSVGAYVIYRLKRNGMAPRAIINERADIITASGCALAGIPLYDISHGRFSDLDVDRVVFERKRSLLLLEASKS